MKCAGWQVRNCWSEGEKPAGGTPDVFLHGKEKCWCVQFSRPNAGFGMGKMCCERKCRKTSFMGEISEIGLECRILGFSALFLLVNSELLGWMDLCSHCLQLY